MNTKKLYLSLLLITMVSFLAIFFSGCKQEDNKITSTQFVINQDLIVLGAGRHLAPGEKDAYYCSKILGVWEPLITRDKEGFPAPALAQNWQMLDEGKVWIFYLRKDVIFHDGSKFNADAVIKNFDRMNKGIKRSMFYGMDINTYYPTLLKYEKLDEYTIKLTFKENNLNQLYKMMDFGSAIFSPYCFNENGDFNGVAIGTGPYKIVENQLNKYVKLKIFPVWTVDTQH